MPIFSRYVCRLLFEVWRWCAVDTVLFMASVNATSHSCRTGSTLKKLMRALSGITFGNRAYIGRGGTRWLASHSEGQYEAASALGLGYWRRTGLVVYRRPLTLGSPYRQHLHFLIKGTPTWSSLLACVDILERLQSTITDPAWRNVHYGGYVFAGLLFLIFLFPACPVTART